jgi:hypothetical protein
MRRRPTIRAAGGVGPALPVLKYISTFRSSRWMRARAISGELLQIQTSTTPQALSNFVQRLLEG